MGEGWKIRITPPIRNLCVKRVINNKKNQQSRFTALIPAAFYYLDYHEKKGQLVFCYDDVLHQKFTLTGSEARFDSKAIRTFFRYNKSEQMSSESTLKHSSNAYRSNTLTCV